MSNTPKYSELNTQMNLSRCKKMVLGLMVDFPLMKTAAPEILDRIAEDPRMQVLAGLQATEIGVKDKKVNLQSWLSGVTFGIALAAMSGDKEACKFFEEGLAYAEGKMKQEGSRET